MRCLRASRDGVAVFIKIGVHFVVSIGIMYIVVVFPAKSSFPFLTKIKGYDKAVLLVAIVFSIVCGLSTSSIR